MADAVSLFHCSCKCGRMLVREEWKRPAGDTTHSQLQVPLREAGCWETMTEQQDPSVYTICLPLTFALWASKKPTFQPAIWANTVHLAYRCTNQQLIPPSWSFVSCLQHLIHLSTQLVREFSHGIPWHEVWQWLEGPGIHICALLHVLCNLFKGGLREDTSVYNGNQTCKVFINVTKKPWLSQPNCSQERFRFVNMKHVEQWLDLHVDKS